MGNKFQPQVKQQGDVRLFGRWGGGGGGMWGISCSQSLNSKALSCTGKGGDVSRK